MPDEQIQEFISKIRIQFADIDEIKSPFLKKIVLVSLLDSMSHAAFPKLKDKNRERVICFLDECSGWTEKDTISAQQLLLRLEKQGISNSRLFLFTQNHLISWQKGTGRIIEPNEDLHDHQVVSIASKKEIELINKARYKELLYTYRNSLVHDFSEPGHGMELFEDKPYPYYHGLEENPWQLVFSASFFRKLCWNSIAGLEKHLRENVMNPYDSYQHGSTW